MTDYSFMKQDNTTHNIVSTDGRDLATIAAAPTKDFGHLKQEIKAGDQSYMCNVCSKPYKSKNYLKNHMKKIHGI